MISSQPAFVVTATELAAQPVATRAAMPIDCRNTELKSSTTTEPDLFLASVPDPRGLPRQNSASHQLRDRRQSALASTPSQLSP